MAQGWVMPKGSRDLEGGLSGGGGGSLPERGEWSGLQRGHLGRGGEVWTPQDWGAEGWTESD